MHVFRGIQVDLMRLHEDIKAQNESGSLANDIIGWLLARMEETVDTTRVKLAPAKLKLYLQYAAGLPKRLDRTLTSDKIEDGFKRNGWEHEDGTPGADFIRCLTTTRAHTTPTGTRRHPAARDLSAAASGFSPRRCSLLCHELRRLAISRKTTSPSWKFLSTPTHLGKRSS